MGQSFTISPGEIVLHTLRHGLARSQRFPILKSTMSMGTHGTLSPSSSPMENVPTAVIREEINIKHDTEAWIYYLTLEPVLFGRPLKYLDLDHRSGVVLIDIAEDVLGFDLSVVLVDQTLAQVHEQALIQVWAPAAIVDVGSEGDVA